MKCRCMRAGIGPFEFIFVAVIGLALLGGYALILFVAVKLLTTTMPIGWLTGVKPVPCPDCGPRVAAKAMSCPNCGYVFVRE